MGAIFVALLLVLGAGSAGGVLHRFFGFDRMEAAVVGIVVLAVLGLFHALIARARDRAEIGDRIADLSRGAADLARQVAEFGRRLAAVETEVARSAERTRAALEPTAAEIELLRRSTKQLAQSVAAHAAALQSLSAASAEAGRPAAVSLALEAMGAPAPMADDPRSRYGAADGAVAAGDGGDGADGVSALRRAAEAGRFELYLQPVVTLPQRKVRYYEAMARLRTEDGRLLNPCDYLRQPQSADVMPMIDDILLFGCVQVVRRLLAKEREIGLFCHIAGPSLLDPAFLGEVSDFIEANRALASCLVFEFTQRQVRAMDATERECLSELAALGFRFSMHRVGDLQLEPAELAQRGFRFVKIPAALLLSRAEAAASGIEASEFSDRLGRFGIDLIAEEIESEAIVVGLLDFDVRFGQGPLFSAPRPVRADLMQGSADRPPSRASGRIGFAATATAAETAVADRAQPPPLAEPFAAAELRIRSGSAWVPEGRSTSLAALVLVDRFSALAAGYDAVLCDVWGVVHNGVAALAPAGDALTRFRKGGGTVLLVSNAPRPGAAVIRMLDRLGVPRSAYDDIITSGDLTRQFIASHPSRCVFHVGPERDRSIFAGLELRFGPVDEADYVICTGLFDDERETPETYRVLLERMRERGLLLFCANPDLVVERGDRLIYCAGAVADLYAQLGGEVLYAGKPHRPIYDAALARIAAARGAPLANARVLAIGDSIRTDLAGAAALGIDGIFITRGIHAEELGHRDDPDLDRLGRFFAEAGVTPKAVMRELAW